MAPPIEKLLEARLHTGSPVRVTRGNSPRLGTEGGEEARRLQSGLAAPTEGQCSAGSSHGNPAPGANLQIAPVREPAAGFHESTPASVDSPDLEPRADLVATAPPSPGTGWSGEVQGWEEDWDDGADNEGETELFERLTQTNSLRLTTAGVTPGPSHQGVLHCPGPAASSEPDSDQPPIPPSCPDERHRGLEVGTQSSLVPPVDCHRDSEWLETSEWPGTPSRPRNDPSSSADSPASQSDWVTVDNTVTAQATLDSDRLSGPSVSPRTLGDAGSDHGDGL